MVSSSSEGRASKISIVRRRSVTRMSACGSRASGRGQASMLHEQQRQKAKKSTGHCIPDTSFLWKSRAAARSPRLLALDLAPGLHRVLYPRRSCEPRSRHLGNGCCPRAHQRGRRRLNRDPHRLWYRLASVGRTGPHRCGRRNSSTRSTPVAAVSSRAAPDVVGTELDAVLERGPGRVALGSAPQRATSKENSKNADG